MERFLQYSLERNRPIRLMWQEPDGKLRQATAIVTAYDAQNVSLYIVRPPKNITVPVSALLSADYKKGDEGGE